MLEGLEIIKKQVESNPRQFVTESAKWDRVTNRMFSNGFPWTDEEKEVVIGIQKAIDAEYREYRRDKFNELVLKTLMVEEGESSYAREDITESGFGLAPMKAEGQRVRLSREQVMQATGLGISAEEYASRVAQIEKVMKEKK